MAEFQSIMKDYRRMCDEYLTRNCDGCPLAELIDADENCRDAIMFKSDKAEEAIMIWSNEHPEQQYPTWKEWYESTFPDRGRDEGICPRTFMKHKCMGIACGDCYSERIPADIAEKLHISPVERSDKK